MQDANGIIIWRRLWIIWRQL